MHTVEKLERITESYDIHLCTKASKQELMALDNKLRQYVKKEKFEPLVATIEKE